MTKTLSHITIRAPLPPCEVRTFHQSLQAANEAWQDFMYALSQREDGADMDALSVFTSFSRFIHELIPDRDLRGRILWSFERQHLQAGSTPKETWQ